MKFDSNLLAVIISVVGDLILGVLTLITNIRINNLQNNEAYKETHKRISKQEIDALAFYDIIGLVEGGAMWNYTFSSRQRILRAYKKYKRQEAKDRKELTKPHKIKPDDNIDGSLDF